MNHHLGILALGRQMRMRPTKVKQRRARNMHPDQGDAECVAEISHGRRMHLTIKRIRQN